MNGRPHKGTAFDFRPVCQFAGACRPRFYVPIPEAQLRALEGAPRARLEIARVEQDHPYAGFFSRRQDGPAHGVGVVVAAAAGTVVKVMELPDHREPRQCHFGVSGPGQREVLLRGEQVRHRVHHFSPRPEITPALLRTAAKSTVKSVGVGVGETRERQAGQVRGAGRSPLVHADRFDRRPIDSQRHVGLDRGATEPGVVAKVLSPGHSGGRGVHRPLAGDGGAGLLSSHSSSPVISSTASSRRLELTSWLANASSGDMKRSGPGPAPIGAARG